MSLPNLISAMSLKEQRSTLSQRGAGAAEGGAENVIWDVITNLWDPQHNPDGYVSLGVAENALMHDVFAQHLKDNLNLSETALTYGDGGAGTKRLRAALARFMNRHFKSVKPVEAGQLTVTNGVTTAIEHCSWALADPGDGFLLGQPYYGAFLSDISFRPGVEVVKVPFGDTDPMSIEGVQNYEHEILSCKEKGQKVKGLMLCSPHNPLGRCYSKEVIVALMKLCQKHHIHFVSDEIYALSVWKNNEDTSPPPVDFISALSIDLEGIIDPNFVHVLWGMSKDFGANGIRLGCVVSQENRAFQAALRTASLYTYSSSISDHITANILEDDAWTDSYIKTNQAKLSEAYSFVVGTLRQHKITYAPGANAAFFLWVDLGKAYVEHHPTQEITDVTATVFATLLEKKIFLASGLVFGSEKPGWFRIVFSQPREYVEMGLKRMIAAVES